MINKKGQGIVNVIFLVGILFLLVIGSLIFAFGTVIIDWTFDEATPELSNLGVVGSANLTEIYGYSLSPVNTVVQNFSWLAGVIYLFALFGCLGFAISFRLTGNKWLIGFFFSCMLLLLITSIFISNIYEDFYTGTDDIAIRLQEMNILSFLILYSPLIMSVIGFVSGIIMFSSTSEEGL